MSMRDTGTAGVAGGASVDEAAGSEGCALASVLAPVRGSELLEAVDAGVVGLRRMRGVRSTSTLHIGQVLWSCSH